MDVETGKISGPFTSCRHAWSDIIIETVKVILSQEGVVIDPEHSAKMNATFDTNAEALEFLARAIAAQSLGKPFREVADLLQQALSCDSNFAFARQFLAHILLYEGERDEAKLQAKRAIELQTDLAPAHHALSMIYLDEGLRYLAQQQLEIAVKCDNELPDSYVALADSYASQHKWQEAMTTLTRAADLAPYDPEIRVRIANLYTVLGQTGKANEELNNASMMPTVDLIEEEKLADAYRLLNDIPRALDHYRAFIARARAETNTSISVAEAEKWSAELESRRRPTFLPLGIRHVGPQTDLVRRLKKELSPNDYKLVTIPFACTAEMKNWTSRVIAGAPTDVDKARRIFQALTCNLRSRVDFFGLTAEEAFHESKKSQPSMTCQDYTLLYMALARSAGLNSFYVLVNQDYSGKNITHACAGVSVGDVGFLVDPVYNWFGAPHKVYEEVNDVRVVAAFLSQSKSAATRKVGLKLAPDWGYAYFWNVAGELSDGNIAEARRVLENGLKLDANSWRALLARASVEYSEEDWDKAENDFRSCLKLAPDYSPARFALGRTLLAKGSLKLARQEFRAYLLGEPTPEWATEARTALLGIDLERSDSH